MKKIAALSGGQAAGLERRAAYGAVATATGAYRFALMPAALTGIFDLRLFKSPSICGLCRQRGIAALELPLEHVVMRAEEVAG
jgi:hypothetical protein